MILPDTPRVIEGSISLAELGLSPKLVYECNGEFGNIDTATGRLTIKQELPPLGTKLSTFRASKALKK
ncbi:MAG: hypothetical protein WCU00_02225 [Candidatus Latescibacterota bacterium]